MCEPHVSQCAWHTGMAAGRAELHGDRGRASTPRTAASSAVAGACPPGPGLPRHLRVRHDCCAIPRCLFAGTGRLVLKRGKCRGPGISTPARGAVLASSGALPAHLRETV